MSIFNVPQFMMYLLTLLVDITITLTQSVCQSDVGKIDKRGVLLGKTNRQKPHPCKSTICFEYIMIMHVSYGFIISQETISAIPLDFLLTNRPLFITMIMLQSLTTYIMT